MKRILALLVLLVMILTAFSSCSFGSGNQQNNNNENKEEEPKAPTSQEILDSISTAMDAAYSYEANVDLNITTYVFGKEVKIEGKGVNVFSHPENADFYFYSQNEINMDINSVKTVTSTVEAYNEGQFFFSYKLGKESKKLYSDLDEERFTEYYELITGDDVFLLGYNEISHTKNEDGTYTVTLGDYDEKAVEAMNSSYGFPMDGSKAKILDFTVTLTVDSDFLISKAVTEYEFSNTKCSGEETVFYKNFNTAEKIVDTINPKDYTKIGDARIAPLLIKLLKDKKDSKEEQTFSFNQNAKSMVMGYSSSSKANNKISYGVDDGDYYFDVEINETLNNYKATYKNGEYKIGKKVDTTKYNDVTAKSFINEFIDPYSFTPAMIKNVSRTGGTGGATYFTIEIDVKHATFVQMLKSSYAAAGATYEKATVTLFVAVDKGEILSMKYTLKSSGYIKSGNHTYNISLDILTTIDFTVKTEKN